MRVARDCTKLTDGKLLAGTADALWDALKGIPAMVILGAGLFVNRVPGAISALRKHAEARLLEIAAELEAAADQGAKLSESDLLMRTLRSRVETSRPWQSSR